MSTLVAISDAVTSQLNGSSIAGIEGYERTWIPWADLKLLELNKIMCYIVPKTVLPSVAGRGVLASDYQVHVGLLTKVSDQTTGPDATMSKMEEVARFLQDKDNRVIDDGGVKYSLKRSEQIETDTDRLQSDSVFLAVLPLTYLAGS